MFGAAVLFQACSRSVSSAKQSAIPVKATAVVTKTMPLELTAIGNVQPMESVDVTSQVTGRIITVDFKEGDFVKKGQLLFSIDSRPFVEAVKEANANLAQSQAAYHVAEANLRNAEAQYGAAKSNVLNQNAGVLSAQGNLNSLKAESDDALSLLNKQKAMFVLAILKAMRRKSAYFSSHVTLTCMLTLSVPASIGTGAAEAIGAAARFSK